MYPLEHVVLIFLEIMEPECWSEATNVGPRAYGCLSVRARDVCNWPMLKYPTGCEAKPRVAYMSHAGAPVHTRPTEGTHYTPHEGQNVHARQRDTRKRQRAAKTKGVCRALKDSHEAKK